MDYTITINDNNMINGLAQIAQANSMTATAYALGIIKSHLKDDLRNLYVAYARKANLADLMAQLGDYTTIKALVDAL